MDRAEVERAHQQLADLESTIEELFLELLGYSAPRMRWYFLAWASLARALEWETGFDASVMARVARIFHRLTQISRIGWPGHVPALNQHARPEECAALLEIKPQAAPRTWSQVLDHAEARITADEQDLELDADGWWKEDVGAPPPPSPEAILRGIRSALEVWGGPLPDARAVRDGHASVEAPPRTPLLVLGDSERADLLKLARQLRWLRNSGLEGWEEAFGRLRLLVDRSYSWHTSGLARVLDARGQPHRSWAHECGHDPGARERTLECQQLVRGLEGIARDDAPALQAWLARAFDLGIELNNEKLVPLLSDRKPQIEAIPVEAFLDRSKRKRLRRLKEMVESGHGLFPLSEPDEPSESPEPAPLEAAPIPPEVLAFTRGKRTLIVGNRQDRELDDTLREQFAMAELDRCDLTPNRVESHAERIERGSYDLVLATTGFMSHKSEYALRKACRSAKVPFVRVNKGRPAACSRALARELGLRKEALENRP